MAVTTMVTAPPVLLRAASTKKIPLREETLRKQTEPTYTPDREERTSFASFKEDDRSDIAQSFLDNPVSSYAIQSEQAIEDDSEDYSNAPSPVSATSSNPIDDLAAKQKKSDMAAAVLAAPLTNPGSNLHAFVCPADGFRGWKEIPVRGKMASRSFSDLRVFNSKGFTWEPKPEKPALVRTPSTFAPGEAPFERLPTEILGQIIDQMVADIPPNGLQPRNVDLMSLLLTSRALHSTTLATLYKQVTIPHSSVFRKLLRHIREFPALGTIVRRLDFSHFNPTGSGITARQRAETQNLTPQTLLECLQLLPNLREFLAQEHIDGELSSNVLRTLFHLPQIRALDFCAASGASFREAMMSVVKTPIVEDLPEYFPIQRLSFHECTVLPALVFETLMPRMSRLTMLDVCHTRITDKALLSLPQTARLTHLNLSKCQSLTGDAVVEFLTNHPAAKELVYLNLHMDSKSSQLLDEDQVTQLLQVLPSTLKFLSFKGALMKHSHISLLAPFTKHVEELGFGKNISYVDIKPLLRKPEVEDKEALAAWVPHSLRYIDISDMEPDKIDFGQLLGRTTNALDDNTKPLEVIEVSERVQASFIQRTGMFKRFGWVPKEAGRRGWLVRDTTNAPEEEQDDGSRSWKMGAKFWGMRKVPVALAEVGGMYGLYMFKR